MTSDELKEYRRSRNWSQATLAAELEVSIHAVQAWEQGKNPIPKVVEKHLLSQTEVNIPLDLIMAINEKARELNIGFDDALFEVIRAGLPTVKKSGLESKG